MVCLGGYDHGTGGMAERHYNGNGEAGLLSLGSLRDGAVGRSSPVNLHRRSLRRCYSRQVENLQLFQGGKGARKYHVNEAALLSRTC